MRDHCSPPAVTSAVCLSAPSRLGGAGAGLTHDGIARTLPQPAATTDMAPRCPLFLTCILLFLHVHTEYFWDPSVYLTPVTHCMVCTMGMVGGVWGSGSAEVSNVNLLDLWPSQTIVGLEMRQNGRPAWAWLSSHTLFFSFFLFFPFAVATFLSEAPQAAVPGR